MDIAQNYTRSRDGGEATPLSRPQGKQTPVNPYTISLTPYIRQALEAQGDRRFKLATVSAAVETSLPPFLIRAYSEKSIARKVAEVASRQVDGSRVWVAVPDSGSGEKWWRKLAACEVEDVKSLLDYRTRQITSLTVSRNRFKQVLATQRAAAETGQVLTYEQALVQIDLGI